MVAPAPGCTITTRAWARGSGSFTVDGASTGEDAFQLPECPGMQDFTPRTFVFNCSRPVDPTPMAGVRIVSYRVTGHLRLR